MSPPPSRPYHHLARARLCASLLLPLVAQADGTWRFGAGLEYSSGDYGAVQSTEIVYAPLLIRYDSDAWRYKITLPYVSVSGPANLVEGSGAATVATSSGAREASGPGDIVLGATRNLYRNDAGGWLVDLTGKLKLASADADAGLGTGEHDLAVQIDWLKQSGAWTWFGDLGKRRMGDTPSLDFRDPWYASLGVAYRPDKRVQWALSHEARQALLSGSGRVAEWLFVFGYDLTPEHSLQLYAVKGIASGSPDRAFGMTLTTRFD